MWLSRLTNTRGRLLYGNALQYNCEIIGPRTPTHFQTNYSHRQDVLHKPQQYPNTLSPYLGIHIEKILTWKAHIKAMKNKEIQRFVSLYSTFKSRTINRKIKAHLYKSIIRPILLYGAPTWGYAATSNMKKLQVIQN
jgi:hypothetical protein